MTVAGLWSRARALLGMAHGSRAFGGPVQATISLTNRCNLRCVHCYFHSPHADMPNFVEVRRAKQTGAALSAADAARRLAAEDADPARTRRLLDRLLALGTRRFEFTGNGEPFLHPEALEFIARVRRGGAYCLSNTNGLLLDPPAMDALLAVGFDDLRVSVLAGDAATYARTHAGSRPVFFDRLRDNLLYLAERKAALGRRRPRVSLAFVILAANADGMLDFARFALETRAEAVIFRAFDDVHDAGLSTVGPTAAQAAGIAVQLEEVGRLLDAQGVRHNVDRLRQVCRARLDTRALYQLVPCYYGWLVTRVETHGDVYPCCRCYTSLGNAFERDFAEVWNGAAYRQFRREARALARRGTPVTGCECYRCVHHNANVQVYRLWHPWRGRSNRLRQACAAVGDGEC